MKKYIKIIIFLLSAVILFASCSFFTNQTAEEQDIDIMLNALKLLGGREEEDGTITIDRLFNYEKTYESEDIRKYFFGTWSYYDIYTQSENLLIVDDSEKNNAHPILIPGIGKIEENVVFKYFLNGGLGAVFWINLDEPDKMYYISELGGGSDDEREVAGKYGMASRIFTVYTKTELLVNEPENGYMSRLRLYEISSEYGIDFSLITNVNYTSEYGQSFVVDDYYFSGRIYLVSESPEKLTLKTVLTSWSDINSGVNAVYSLEKINGVWEQAIDEVSEEQLAEASEKYKEKMKELLSTTAWKHTGSSDIIFTETEKIKGTLCLVYKSEKDEVYSFAVDESGAKKYYKKDIGTWIPSGD